MMGWGCKPGGANAPDRLSLPLPRARGRTRCGRAGLRNGDYAGRCQALLLVRDPLEAGFNQTRKFIFPQARVGFGERAGRGARPERAEEGPPTPDPRAPARGNPERGCGPTETTRPRRNGRDAGEAEDLRGTGETGPPRGASRPAMSRSGERGRAHSPIPPRVQKADYGPHSPPAN